jgi:hypothetical protein
MELEISETGRIPAGVGLFGPKMEGSGLRSSRLLLRDNKTGTR